MNIFTIYWLPIWVLNMHTKPYESSSDSIFVFSNTLISDIDLENDIKRFIKLSDWEYPYNTIMQYKARIKRGISWYLRHDEDPNWQPVTRFRRCKYEYNIKDITQPNTKEGKMYTFLVPLRNGKVIATLHMPPVLDKTEAKRMSDLINCLVADNENEEQAEA